MQRIAVVGASCSGKTTLSERLARGLGVAHVQLDELYWGPNWTEKPADEFRRLVDEATTGPGWVCDGNYNHVRDLIWARADTIVWLNYSLPVVFLRGLRRTIRRAWTGERLFGDNVETFRKSFLSRDSVLLWVLKGHARYRRGYPRKIHRSEFHHLTMIELQHPRDAEAFLAIHARGLPEPAVRR